MYKVFLVSSAVPRQLFEVQFEHGTELCNSHPQLQYTLIHAGIHKTGRWETVYIRTNVNKYPEKENQGGK